MLYFNYCYVAKTKFVLILLFIFEMEILNIRLTEVKR